MGVEQKKRQLKNNHQNQTHVSRTEANKNKPDMHTKPCIIHSLFHSGWCGVGWSGGLGSLNKRKTVKHQTEVLAASGVYGVVNELAGVES